MMQSKISSIVLFGETLADEFPEQKIIGGAPFNVARTLAHFGCAPLMISRIGQDAIGELIQADMQRCGMSAIGLQVDAARPSGRVVVTQNNPADNSNHQFEILPDQAYDYIEQVAAQHAVAAYCQNQPAGLIYFGSLAQRSLTSRLSLNALLKEEKTLKYLDLNLRNGQVNAATIDDSLCRADIVKLNEDELGYLLDHYSGNACTALDLNADRLSWKPALDGLMKQFDLLAIIVTTVLVVATGFWFIEAGEIYSTGKWIKKLDVRIFEFEEHLDKVRDRLEQIDEALRDLEGVAEEIRDVMRKDSKTMAETSVEDALDSVIESL